MKFNNIPILKLQSSEELKSSIEILKNEYKIAIKFLEDK